MQRNTSKRVLRLLYVTIYRPSIDISQVRFSLVRPRERRSEVQCRPQKIKGAARRSVRPKSREETPKEGNETDELVVGLASPI